MCRYKAMDVLRRKKYKLRVNNCRGVMIFPWTFMIFPARYRQRSSGGVARERGSPLGSYVLTSKAYKAQRYVLACTILLADL